MECKQRIDFLSFNAFRFISVSFERKDTITSSTALPTSAPRKKSSSKKTIKNNGRPNVNKNVNNGSNYEHHLEKWLENTSKMNFDYNNLEGNWPFMNAPNAFQQQQQPPNRKGNGSHLQHFGSNDPISLPSHIVSFSALLTFIKATAAAE